MILFWQRVVSKAVLESWVKNPNIIKRASDVDLQEIEETVCVANSLVVAVAHRQSDSPNHPTIAFTPVFSILSGLRRQVDFDGQVRVK